MSDCNLIEELCRWLEQERIRYSVCAKKIGIGLSVPIRQFVVNPRDESSYDGTYVLKHVSPVLIRQYAWELHDAVAQENGFRLALARLLYERYGRSCQVWTPYCIVTFETEPERWIETTLLTRLKCDYLEQLPSLDTPAPDLTHDLSTHFLSLLERDSVDLITFLPIAGIRFMEDVISHEDVTFRRLSGEELGDLFGDPLSDERVPSNFRLGFCYESRERKESLTSRGVSDWLASYSE